MPRHLKIFVAWPSDVEEERNRAEKVIQDLNRVFKHRDCHLEMLDWKTVPASGGNPEQVILDEIKPSEWDVFLGILWKRFGTPPNYINPHTGQPYTSGFEAEYDMAHALWQEDERPHLMLYRCNRPISSEIDDLDQLGLVRDFFHGIEKRYEVLYKRYGSPEDFAEKFSLDLTAVVEKILKIGPRDRPTEFPHSRLFEDIADETDFSNREYELSHIQNILATDREASVMVYAATGMGKSRLKERLIEVLSQPFTSSPMFHCVQLNCRDNKTIGSSIDNLLAAIHQSLGKAIDSNVGVKELRHQLRIQIMDLKATSKRLILLLDQIELMKEECRSFLRHELLPELRETVSEPSFYPSIIAFGRVNPREWRGEETVRFEAMTLSPFRKAIIVDILRRKSEEMNLPFPHRAYDQWAEYILKVSHGHPRCILNLVSWLCEEKFSITAAKFDSKEIFQSFVVPVIEREIFSDDNLAPREPIERVNIVANKLRRVLPYACVFRFYSNAQLRILADCKLIEESEITELEEQLSHTFLIDHPTKLAWFKPHDTIRRLLADWLKHQQPQVFTMINQAACQFYDRWVLGDDAPPNLMGERVQDHDQVYYIVEGLYHHSLAFAGRDLVNALKEKLTHYLKSLRGHHPIKQMTGLLANNLRDDGELRQIIQQNGQPDDYENLITFANNRNN